jgi:hypothetical protein
MAHVVDGILRRMIDEPEAVTDAERQHVARCGLCSERRDAIAADAQLPAGMLPTADVPDARAAYSRYLMRERIATGRSTSSSAAAGTGDAIRRRYGRFAAPAAAAVAIAAAIVLLFFTPVGTLAQNFLTIFEPVHFVAIPVTQGEFQYLPDLGAFGTIVRHPAYDVRGQVIQPRAVAGAAQAAALTGVPVRLPAWLPPEVPQPARFAASPREFVTFTFSAHKALAYARASRVAMPPMPSGLDGSTLTLQAGPMDVVSFGVDPALAAQHHTMREAHEHGMHLPPLVIVESAAPQVTSTGATARDIEAYLVQMPGMSPQLAAQIRAIGDPGTTMPIPVPIDEAFAQNVAIDGVSGLAIGDNTGVGGVIMWQKYGVVYAVAGAMPQRDLMHVAASLR